MEQADAFSFSRLDRHFKYDLRVTSNIETAFLVLVAEHVELLSDSGGSVILLPITRGCNCLCLLLLHLWKLLYRV